LNYFFFWIRRGLKSHDWSRTGEGYRYQPARPIS
jgi:hypothetical protein